MYRKYKTNIPIYFGKLVLVQSDSIEEVNKRYNFDYPVPFSAMSCWDIDKKGHSRYHIIFLASGLENRTIAHECLHIVNRIFKDRGITLDPDNDEPQCYLLGWLVDQCEQFLKTIK